MSVKKVIMTSLLSMGICSAAFTAYAGGALTIDNTTDFDSTSVINAAEGGVCSSTVLGDYGITKKHTKREIDPTIIGFACLLNSSNCTADVYMSDDCSGPKIGVVVFDVDAGIKSVTSLPGTNFQLAGTGFSMTIDGGPVKLLSKN